MDPAALEAPPPQHSTTVRPSAFPPDQVARAVAAFFTPGRNQRGVRPWAVEGVTAHPLRLSLNGQTLSAWRFGESSRRIALAHYGKEMDELREMNRVLANRIIKLGSKIEDYELIAQAKE